MDLYEVEGKAIFRQHGIPVPSGKLYTAQAAPSDYPYPCVVKAQVLSGKRGKAGGVKFAADFAALRECAEQIAEMSIYGEKVAAVLVEERLDIAAEHYLGLTIDPIAKAVVLMYSPSGGMDIETLARTEPGLLLRRPVAESLNPADLAESLRQFNLADGVQTQLLAIAGKAVRIFYELDATTLEINPLVVTAAGTLLAADAKLVLDDNAGYRQAVDKFLQARRGGGGRCFIG